MRLLRKYFYKNLRQLGKHLSEHPHSPSPDENIFDIQTENPAAKMFRLKDNIKFHLFISSAPCGDGRIFSINDKTAHHAIDKYLKIIFFCLIFIVKRIIV